MCFLLQEEECLITEKQETVLGQAGLTPDIIFTEAPVTEESVSMEVERLRRELTTALKGQDVDAQGIMKWLEHLQQTEQVCAWLTCSQALFNSHFDVSC